MNLVAIRVEGQAGVYRLHDADTCKVFGRSPHKAWAYAVRVDKDGRVFAGQFPVTIGKPCRSCKATPEQGAGA